MFIYASSVPWTDNYATLSEKLFIGVTMALLGITIVVVVLALITLFVSLMSRIINAGGKSGPDSRKGIAASAAPMQVKVPEQETPPDEAADDQLEKQTLAAVISAAVAAFTADAAPRSSAGFIIRRVRRV